MYWPDWAAVEWQGFMHKKRPLEPNPSLSFRQNKSLAKVSNVLLRPGLGQFTRSPKINPRKQPPPPGFSLDEAKSLGRFGILARFIRGEGKPRKILYELF